MNNCSASPIPMMGARFVSGRDIAPSTVPDRERILPAIQTASHREREEGQSTN